MDYLSQILSYLPFPKHQQATAKCDIDAGNLARLKTPPVPFSLPRLRLEDGIYRIWVESDLNHNIVFIRTKCVAIVEYCVPGYTARLSKKAVLRPALTEEVTTELRLRMRRCGAVDLDLSHLAGWEIGGYCDAVLSASLHDCEYVLGWPMEQHCENGVTKEPVWVGARSRCSRHQNKRDDACQECLSCEERDKQLDNELEAAKTMQQYCAILEAWGATYYGDERDSPEVRKTELKRTQFKSLRERLEE